MEITRQRWHTLGNGDVGDILGAVGDLVKRGHVVHIGTDAQKATGFTDFVVVACLLSPERRGHRVFYTSLRKRRMSLQQKLFWETWISTQLALELCAVGSVESHDQIHVHLDLNPSAVHKSSRYLEQMAGLVVGQGFPVLYKPDAWAASRAADHAVKARSG
jgi:predicted RNase H-related nuclease YkuK (DUF458 family)